MKLNLVAKNTSQQAIKDYLENNVSQILADKINNGVQIEKDGKTLLNKKDLDGFWNYASKKARELKHDYEDNDTVFGWAIHYFEENELIGSLFNLDGTKYEPPKPVSTIKTPTVTTPPIKKNNPAQVSLFDFTETKTETLDNKVDKKEINDSTEEEVEEEIDETVEEEMEETVEEKVVETKPKGNPIYNTYQDVKDSYVTSVIAMRLGDFYEIFGQDAVTIAKELDLTLVGRDCGLDHRIPMIGFPYHCAENYFDKIAENHSLIAIDTNGTFITTIPQKETTKTRKSNEEDVEKEFKTSNDSSEDDLQKETELMKAFDQESLIKLLDLFGENVAIG